MNSRNVNTRVGEVTLDSNGIIIIRLKDAGIVDEFDIIDLNLAIKHLCEDTPRLKMVVASDDWQMDKKAKKRAEVEDRSTFTLARAIVVSGKIKAKLFNYMASYNKSSPFPHQFFSSEEDAYAWLLSLQNKAI